MFSVIVARRPFCREEQRNVGSNVLTVIQTEFSNTLPSDLLFIVI